LTLTSNFGESPFPETTTRREADPSPATPPPTTTEFYPSQTHNINFDFDAEVPQGNAVDQAHKEEG
jgi:hypothetical protein